jgi:hypothetical protein
MIDRNFTIIGKFFKAWFLTQSQQDIIDASAKGWAAQEPL